MFRGTWAEILRLAAFSSLVTHHGQSCTEAILRPPEEKDALSKPTINPTPLAASKMRAQDPGLAPPHVPGQSQGGLNNQW